MLTLALALTRALTTDPNPGRDPDPNQVGPSPAIMHVSNLRKLAPLWYELSVQMKADREADGAFGWMLEMWGYSIGAGAPCPHTSPLSASVQRPAFASNMRLEQAARAPCLPPPPL